MFEQKMLTAQTIIRFWCTNAQEILFSITAEIKEANCISLWLLENLVFIPEAYHICMLHLDSSKLFSLVEFIKFDSLII